MTPDNDILLRPAMSFAILKILPLVILSISFLILAWAFSPLFLFPCFGILGIAWYRLLFIRSCSYLITPAEIRSSRGIFFKRTDFLEMYRIKDYVVTRPLPLQMLRLMNVTLKSTDIENPVLQLVGIPLSDIIDTIREHVQEARKNNHIYEIN
ncbi:PH domain-containing protein [Mucilaginibacter aquariorum]|uniref:PH domain-containing protein n=1 Tax=Mucilaginibacter aquariorum TaxID=2967225 RepID=A0ABT1SZA6_9SPHI|nr:PH domain-containing protein [Mucilaginibacter aquariorum]MCQ6957053.1 PH domain-containing protein [Mucilaginibacter aquariorum]